MADPFLAEIRLYPFTFAPRGWAFCNGQLLPISQNTALFSLLVTTYGGDGRSTFALPDLQGRAPMHPRQGPGLSHRALGEMGGTETVTLTESQIPAHTHQLRAVNGVGSDDQPHSSAGLATPIGARTYRPGPLAPAATMHASALAPAGGGHPHNNMQPYLTVNFCIALQGIYPSRP